MDVINRAGYGTPKNNDQSKGGGFIEKEGKVGKYFKDPILNYTFENKNELIPLNNQLREGK